MSAFARLRRSLLRGSACLVVIAVASARAAAPPLAFVPADAADEVDFVARGAGYGVAASGGGWTLTLLGRDGTARRVRFALGTMPAGGRSVDGDALPGRASIFHGADSSRWRGDLPTFARVRYADVAPGTDLVLHGDDGRLEYDLLLAPGADPDRLGVDVRGADGLRLRADGSVALRIDAREVTLAPPLAYQEYDGARAAVAVRHVLRPDGRLGFAVGPHDPSRPLVIDPVIEWATYLGGTNDTVVFHGDRATAVATDAAGDVYVTGWTTTTDFPVVGAAQAQPGGDTNAFVTKLSADGTTIRWSTYLGGAFTRAWAIAVDAEGGAWITGETDDEFPLVHPLRSTVGTQDAFVTRIAPDGASLTFSTYLGGSAIELGRGIAFDPQGRPWIVGCSNFAVQGSDDPFPTTADAIVREPLGHQDAFAVRLAADGSALEYGTLLGGALADCATAVAVDRDGRPVIAGDTASTDFPTTAGAFQEQSAGGAIDDDIGLSDVGEGFVTRLAADGHAIEWSTYFGGSDGDRIGGVAVDAGGRVTIVGGTLSTDLPTTAAAQSTPGGARDGFVARFTPAGDALAFAGYLGGSGNDEARGVALTPDGDALIAGETQSSDFPGVDPLTEAPGFYDAFATRMRPDGSVVWQTWLGGSFVEAGSGVASDPQGAAIVVGLTESNDFPVHGNVPFPTQRSTSSNAFVARLIGAGASGLTDVFPHRGGDGGEVTVHAYGSRFAPGARLELRHAGDAARVATGIGVAPGGGELAGIVDLSGAANGAWDVAVIDADGHESVLPAAFAVEPASPRQLAPEVLGPSVIKTGRDTAFAVTVENAGNTDVTLVPIWVGPLPAGATVRLLSPTVPPAPIPSAPDLDVASMPPTVRFEGADTIALLAYRIGALDRVTVRFTLSVPNDSTFRLTAWTTRPWNEGRGRTASPQPTLSDGCANALAGAAIDALGLVPGVGCGAALALGLVSKANTAAGTVLVGGANGEPPNTAVVGQLILTELGQSAACGLTSIPALGTVVVAVQLAYDTAAVGDACKDDFNKKNPNGRDVKSVKSKDPNDKAGAAGLGPRRWLAVDRSLPYAIEFENTPTATAPAQRVVVTDQLDTTRIDVSTFSLGPIAFGSYGATPPPGLTTWSTRLDLRPASPLLVDVDAGLDPQSGVVRWTFQSLDPATEQPPADPLVGFLPPNRTPPDGDGSVVFFVRPRSDTAAGGAIANAASIVFDDNETIATPTWTNRVHPACAVSAQPLAAATCAADDARAVRAFLRSTCRKHCRCALDGPVSGLRAALLRAATAKSDRKCRTRLAQTGRLAKRLHDRAARLSHGCGSDDDRADVAALATALADGVSAAVAHGACRTP